MAAEVHAREERAYADMKLKSAINGLRERQMERKEVHGRVARSGKS